MLTRGYTEIYILIELGCGVERPEQNLMSHILSLSRNNLIFSSVSDFVKTPIDRKSPMIQSFSIFNGNNFPESYLSKVFTLSSNLSYVAAPGTARHCYVETVTLRLARSQQNIVTERRCD